MLHREPDVTILNWLVSVLSPRFRRPPEVLGADEPDVIASAVEASLRKKRALTATDR